MEGIFFRLFTQRLEIRSACLPGRDKPAANPGRKLGVDRDAANHVGRIGSRFGAVDKVNCRKILRGGYRWIKMSRNHGTLSMRSAFTWIGNINFTHPITSCCASTSGGIAALPPNARTGFLRFPPDPRWYGITSTPGDMPT